MDYVEQLLVKLKAVGFIKSRRGKHGGSVLARRADNISVAALLEIIEGEMSLVPCMMKQCDRRRKCPTRPLRKEANDVLKRIFEGATIADLAQEKGSAVLSSQI